MASVPGPVEPRRQERGPGRPDAAAARASARQDGSAPFASGSRGVMWAASFSDAREKRACISAAARTLIDLGLIWRETPDEELGVHGEVELVGADGAGLGRRALIRVEAGPAPVGDGVDRHAAIVRRRWAAHPLPFVVVFQHPAGAAASWVDGRARLGLASRQGAETLRPRRLDPASVTAFLQTCGSSGDAWLETLPEVLGRLLERRGGPDFPLSHFDLFVHGLSDIGRSLYFGTDLALFVAEQNLDEAADRLAAGPREHAFLFDFVRFMVGQNLAGIDFSRRLIDWVDHGRQAQFVAPLSPRGRKLVGLIQSVERELVAAGALPDAGYAQAAQEGFFALLPQSLTSRLPRIRAMQDALRDGSRGDPAS